MTFLIYILNKSFLDIPFMVIIIYLTREYVSFKNKYYLTITLFFIIISLNFINPGFPIVSYKNQVKLN